MTRARAVYPLPEHTRLADGAEITFTLGAPVKDPAGNVIGTIIGTRSHPDGIEIEFELHEGMES